MSDVEPLRATVRNYPWGSRTAIPALRGEPASDLPVAELWMGAHPSGSSILPDRLNDRGEPMTLVAAIEENPAAELGSDVIERFGVRLPFLLKLLAAAEPLSLQAHPSAAQAVDGFAREDAEGVDRLAPDRSFRDRYHKPEMVVALDEFEALVGFRPPDETLEFFEALAVPELAETADALHQGLAAALDQTIRLPRPLAADAAAAIVKRAPSISGRWRHEAALLARIAHAYPTDPGVVTAALLNRVVLREGESVHLGPGVLHCYIDGLVVEIMANSDNVVRGGLSQKHVDIDVLMSVVIPEPHPPKIASARAGETVYEADIEEFELVRYEGERRDERVLRGPEIVVCVAGSASVETANRSVDLRPGDSAWIPASADRAMVTTRGKVFAAGVGR